MSITAVGSIALDTITTAAGTSTDVLGGSLTYFSLAASRFASVHLVAVVGRDFPSEYIGWLRERDIHMDGVEQLDGETFRWSGKYSDDFSTRETLSLALNVFQEFQPNVPAAACQQPYLFLGNIDPTLQHHVLQQVQDTRCVAIDTIDFWIHHKRAELEALFPHINIFLLNDEEACLLAGTDDVMQATQWLLDQGLACAIVKQGAAGCLLATNDGITPLPAFHLDTIADPTGAGDSFAGGLVGYLASIDAYPTHETLIDAIRYAAAVASFCVESVSVHRVRSMTRDDIESRVAHLRAQGILT